MAKPFKIFCLLACFFLISRATVLCQKLPFRNYLEKDGLPSPIVCCIYQDSRGYLWIGTDKGLSRFDGVEFKNFEKDAGLRKSKIISIREDRRGNIWVGGENGVSRISADGASDNSWPNILSGCSVYAIVEDEEEKLWFGTSGGLGCFDGKTIRRFTAPDYLHTDRIIAIAIEKKGKLWLGTDKGLYCYKKDNFTACSRYSTENGLLDNFISTLLVDSGGNLWIGTIKGLTRLKDGKTASYTRQDGLSDNSVTSLMEDRSGNIWIGTWNGINLFSREKFIGYSTKNGLPNNFIYSISQDREGNIWLGTHGGVSYLNSLNIRSYTKENGLPNDMVIAVIQDKKGRYWFGTSEGLSCYDRGNFKNYTTKNGLIGNAINHLMEDRWGNIWIATSQGLSIFSSGTFTNYTEKDGLPGNILFDLVETRDGTIWIGNRRGLIRFINGEFSGPPFDLEEVGVFYIIEDSGGNLWFSSGTSLYTYSGNRLTSISDLYSLPDNEIYALFEDSKGKIWIGSEGGLSCFYKGRFTHYSTKNSTLRDNECYCVLEDRRGNLWIGHSKGLSSFNGSEFRPYASKRLGLADSSWLTGIKDNRGNLWFGTTEGVTAFDTPPVRLNVIPPPAYITGLKVMEKDVPLAGARQFTYNQNIFRFNFVGISFSDPTGIKYRYQMKNIDKDWQTTWDRSLFYPFLPPGSYTLKLKAVNTDGFESMVASEYTFVILPPFWQTWWFLLLVGLSAGSLLFLVIRWRMKRDREIAELKARNQQLVMWQRMELMGNLAAGTVHDLKNLLTVIIGYSRVMSKKFHHDDDDNYQNIEIIKNTAATAVQMAKQILAFARPKNQPFEPVELGMVLSEILETLKVRQPKNIRLLWEPQVTPIFFPIQPARFQQLVMNLCLNAFEAMPEGGQLRISLSPPKNKEITLEVSNTGPIAIKKENLNKIFDPLFTTKEHNKGTGLGLFVVKQIVADHQGKIEVHSEPGQGTSFIIKLPSTSKNLRSPV